MYKPPYRLKNLTPTAVIDNIRIAAPSPLLVYTPRTSQYGIVRGGLRWRRHNIASLIQPYVYSVVQLSRYNKGKYEKKLEETDSSFQNNESPYSYTSAAALTKQAVDSYIALSPCSSSLDSDSVRISMLECAFDLPCTAPSLEQLVDFVSHGRGSGRRFLQIITYDKQKYTYDKHTNEWRDTYGNPRTITGKEYFKQLFSWNWCVYVGTKNYRITIYRKNDKIRHEIRYRKNAALKKALLKNRHISVLQNRTVVEHLFRETARRICALYHREIPSIESAIHDMLKTFDNGRSEKHEPRVPGREAFYIDGCISAPAINQVSIYNYSIVIHLGRSALSFSVWRIRAPPRLFPPVHSSIQTYTVTAACMR